MQRIQNGVWSARAGALQNAGTHCSAGAPPAIPGGRLMHKCCLGTGGGKRRTGGSFEGSPPALTQWVQGGEGAGKGNWGREKRRVLECGRRWYMERGRQSSGSKGLYVQAWAAPPNQKLCMLLCTNRGVVHVSAPSHRRPTGAAPPQPAAATPGTAPQPQQAWQRAARLRWLAAQRRRAAAPVRLPGVLPRLPGFCPSGKRRRRCRKAVSSAPAAHRKMGGQKDIGRSASCEAITDGR